MTRRVGKQSTGICHARPHEAYNNPRRIYFTDGSQTRYKYSATGEKLLVEHYVGSLTLRNGRVDKLQFEEGYCQAAAYSGNTSQDNFTFHYYDRDHLGNIRQVIKATGSTKGTVIQTMDYYPFGAEFCDGSTASEVQPYKYNGKEFDNMHGLDTYDYGARQYNPVTARWDRVDPLCEKYYGVSPYVYCHNNPVMFIDPNGCKDTVFVKGKDRPVSEDPNTRTPLYYPDGSPNSGAYNCHMYAWSSPDGDPSDIVNPLFPKWDEHPENNMVGYTQLNTNEPNEVDDRLIYYIDENSDGKYQKGEQIVHSAIVFQVDKEGYTTEVISKMGQGGISRNHPRAPGFYEEHNGQKTSRAYYRETKKWILHSNRHSSSSPKYHHVERPDALYVAPKFNRLTK